MATASPVCGLRPERAGAVLGSEFPEPRDGDRLAPGEGAGNGGEDGAGRGGGIGLRQRCCGGEGRAKVGSVHGFSRVCARRTMVNEERSLVEGETVREAPPYVFRRQIEADLKATRWNLLAWEGPALSAVGGILQDRCRDGRGAGGEAGAVRPAFLAPSRAQGGGDVLGPAAARRHAGPESVAGRRDRAAQGARRRRLRPGAERPRGRDAPRRLFSRGLGPRREPRLDCVPSAGRCVLANARWVTARNGRWAPGRRRGPKPLAGHGPARLVTFVVAYNPASVNVTDARHIDSKRFRNAFGERRVALMGEQSGNRKQTQEQQVAPTEPTDRSAFATYIANKCFRGLGGRLVKLLSNVQWSTEQPVGARPCNISDRHPPWMTRSDPNFWLCGVR